MESIYSSHRIGCLVSDYRFASGFPVQVENTRNKRRVRNRMAVPYQRHQLFAPQVKQGGELWVLKQCRYQLRSDPTLRRQPFSLLEPQRNPVRFGCDRDLRMCTHDMAEQGRSGTRASNDKSDRVSHRRALNSLRSAPYCVRGSRARASRILDALSTFSSPGCEKVRGYPSSSSSPPAAASNRSASSAGISVLQSRRPDVIGLRVLFVGCPSLQRSTASWYSKPRKVHSAMHSSAALRISDS